MRALLCAMESFQKKQQCSQAMPCTCRRLKKTASRSPSVSSGDGTGPTVAVLMGRKNVAAKVTLFILPLSSCTQIAS